jgi:NADPH:quinone reductase-like Zn-dependent oxidoreductase
MKAVRVHQFGGIDAITYEELPCPIPNKGQVLVRVKAAGVGPWDAWIRAGKSVLFQPLPLILGSDLSGVVESVGSEVSDFQPGDEIFGVTSPQFTGAQAEYALAEVNMIARKPARLGHVEAASVPVVAVTAWQMLHDHGQVDDTKRVLVHGAAGNVGSYAVQLAKRAGAEVVATALSGDIDYVRTLGADQVIDVQTVDFEEKCRDVDVVLDTVGGETLARSFQVLKPGGILISAVAKPNQEEAERRRIRAVFILVAVTSAVLIKIAALLESGELKTRVGEVLPLDQVRLAHEMLAGKPHKPGKIVLALNAG